MSLKLIPHEQPTNSFFSKKPKKENQNANHIAGNRKKDFNPGHALHNVKNGESGFFKSICLQLIHYINRGSRFTCTQIDELIISLQRSILSLQKKKQELMRRKK